MRHQFPKHIPVGERCPIERWTLAELCRAFVIAESFIVRPNGATPWSRGYFCFRVDAERAAVYAIYNALELVIPADAGFEGRVGRVYQLSWKWRASDVWRYEAVGRARMVAIIAALEPHLDDSARRSASHVGAFAEMRVAAPQRPAGATPGRRPGWVPDPWKIPDA